MYSRFDYIKVTKNEIILFSGFSILLSIFFSALATRFTEQTSFITYVITFFVFFLILFYGRILFMKWVAYNNGLELEFESVHFDRYGLRNYDTMSSLSNAYWVNNKKGLPAWVISIIIYILSVGFLIWPGLWRIHFKKIPHKFVSSTKFAHVGFGELYETDAAGYDYVKTPSSYRKSKIFFAGFLYYFIFACIMKVAASVFNTSYTNWYTLSLIYIALITLINIPALVGTLLFSINYEAFEGMLLWLMNSYAWIGIFTILVTGFISLLIFNNLLLIILISIISFGIVILLKFWKQVLKPAD